MRLQQSEPRVFAETRLPVTSSSQRLIFVDPRSSSSQVSVDSSVIRFRDGSSASAAPALTQLLSVRRTHGDDSHRPSSICGAWGSVDRFPRTASANQSMTCLRTTVAVLTSEEHRNLLQAGSLSRPGQAWLSTLACSSFRPCATSMNRKATRMPGLLQGLPGSRAVLGSPLF